VGTTSDKHANPAALDIAARRSRSDRYRVLAAALIVLALILGALLLRGPGTPPRYIPVPLYTAAP
jgi:hypothetical protein